MRTASIQTEPSTELYRLLAAFRRRLGLEQIALRSMRALSLAFAALFGLYLVGWVARWSISTEIALGLLAVLLASSILGGASRWPSAARAAREADRRLDLEERMITALDSVQFQRTTRVSDLQISGAVDVGRERLPEWRADRQALKSEALRALALGCLALAMALYSSFSSLLPLPRPDIGTLANPVLDPPADEQGIPDPPPLPKPESSGGSGAVNPVLRALDDLRRARNANGVSQEDAARRVSQAESEIQRQASQSQQQRQDLNRLARGLGQTSAGRQAAESIQQGDYQQAANQLAELGNEADQLSQAAKEQLANELRAAAGETTQNRLLADRERRASEALSGRDYAQQRRALRDLGDEVARAGSFVVPQQELAEGMSRVREAQQELGQSPDSTGQENDRQAQNPSGQATNQSSANASTTQGAAAQQQARQPGGVGFGDGNGSGQAANGSAAGGDQAGQNRQDSAPRLDVLGRRVEVPVKVGRGPTTQRPGTDDPVGDEEAPLSVTSSNLNQPQDPSAAAAERNLVPSDRRQTVRDYFRGESSR